MTYTSDLIEKIYNIKYKNLKADVVSNVKEGLIHYFYCIFLGTNSKTFGKAFKIEKINNSINSIYPIFFSGNKSSFFDSIFYNALIAQEILHEDIHKKSNSHPGIIIFPSALTTARHLNSSGKEFIESVVTGYETMCQIGMDIDRNKLNEKGFRPTSILGVLGSAATVSRLLNLNKAQIENGLSLAVNTASGLNSWAKDGTEELFIQNGLASKNGTISAFLAKENIESAKNILEAENGYFNAFAALNVNNINMANDYLIKNIQYKLVPACALIQSAGILGIKMRDFNFDEIENITIETHMLGKHYPGCDFKGPFKSIIQARMSNQYLLAASMKYNSISNFIYNDFTNNNIYKMTNKIDIKVNSEFDKVFPNRQPMKVIVTFTNGDKKTLEISDSQYVSKDRLKENFLNVLTQKRHKNLALEILATIDKLEDLENLNGLFDLLAKIK